MKKYIFLILIGALILRFVVINQSLWLDEAIGALVVKNQTFLQILSEFPKHDNHPPLYYLFLKLWSNIFGYSEIALRSLSVLFGVGTIYFVYKIGKLFDKRLGEISAILIATSQFHIYYSQEARMYALAAFFATVAFYLFFRKKWALFSITLAAMIFTDYMPAFLLPTFWIIGILKKNNKKWWKKFVLSHIPLVVLGLAWAPIFLTQLANGRWLVQALPGWQSIAGGATLKQAVLVWMKFTLGRISFTDKTPFYLLVGVCSIPFLLVLYKAWKEREKVISLWLFLLLPLVLGFLVSFFIPAFIYFRYVYVVPAFYLFLSWGVINFRIPLFRNVLLVGILAVNFISWGIYVLDSHQQREQWRQAVTFVESKAKYNEVVLFNFTEPFAPYQWYEKGIVPAKGLTDSLLANPIPTRTKTIADVEKFDGAYYFEYLWQLHDPDQVVLRTLKDIGFIDVAIFDFPGVGAVRYLKRL